MKAPQKSLKNWTKQKWRTKSGKPSSKTGERYLPSAAIKSLSSAEYAATTRAKRKGKAAGKQHVAQPKKIADKTRRFRANKGGVVKSTKQQAAIAINMKKKSTVNKAGNYTKPTMRKNLFNRIKAGGKGGAPGQWSARKAQMLAKQYKAKGGGYK